ncbi:AAA family ATPase [Endozoicomonas euniceicola]|uniref:Helicase RepA family protein n=1 Tax=Endozoicomonas euniceicola TaxID=1234143 RepID=A0ABY6GZK1_9GAMM|nr:helicase RepA family protein [Endozoicomonas euniceicola]UYM18220.1 helicase RepA family protein [Endozoicomonas euniceicola]
MTDSVYNTTNTPIQPAPEVVEFFGAEELAGMQAELEADNAKSLAATGKLYLKHNTADGTPRKRALDDDTAEQLADGHITEEQLQQRLKERFKGTMMARSESKPQAPDWLVWDWFEKDSVSCVFAPPASGKSFMTIDLACCVATGTPWQGHDVEQGFVFYIAGEGYNGIKRRLEAWQIKNNQDIDPTDKGGLAMTDSPILIGEPDGLLELFDNIDYCFDGVAPNLVVIDTVARCFGSGDENSTRDMNAFVKAVDLIKKKYGCTVLLVHHTGHGTQERGRGSSVLIGALDSEYKIKKSDDSIVTLSCTKMKDGVEPKPMNMEFATVDLGVIDKKGRMITSAVLLQTDKEPQQDTKPVKLSANHEAVMQAIRSRTAIGESCTVALIRDDLKAHGLNVNAYSKWITALVEKGLVRIDGDTMIPICQN